MWLTGHRGSSNMSCSSIGKCKSVLLLTRGSRTAEPGNVLTCCTLNYTETKILPDFARVDTEFFVEKTTGQVIDQHRAIAGAWKEKTETKEQDIWDRLTQKDKRSQAIQLLNLAASTLWQDQRGGVSEWHPSVFPVSAVGVDGGSTSNPVSLSSQYENIALFHLLQEKQLHSSPKHCLIKYCRTHLTLWSKTLTLFDKAGLLFIYIYLYCNRGNPSTIHLKFVIFLNLEKSFSL